MESVASLGHSFLNVGGRMKACRTAIIDLGLDQIDPGLTPNGAKCAPEKVKRSQLSQLFVKDNMIEFSLSPLHTMQ